MRIRELLLSLLVWCAAGSAAAQGVDQVLLETFDGVTAPALPEGWATTNDAWETSASSASSGSGSNNAFSRGSSAGDLTMPSVDLTGAITAELSYLARRTSSYDLMNLRIAASIDGGTTFPVEVVAAGSALPVASSVYETITVSLPATLLGEADVIFRFEAAGNSSSSANARLDDVSVTAMRLVLVAPTNLSFLALPGGTDAGTVTLTNEDASSLQVSAPVVGGTAYSVEPTGPVTVAPGGSQVYTVSWSPQVPGTDNRTLLLTHEHGTATVSLEGRTAGGILGFQADTSGTVAGDSLHVVPLRLDFSNPAGLQGLQFTVGWDDPALRLADVVRGEAVADSLAWTVSFESDTAAATVVLLGSGTTSLTSGTRDSLLSLRFELPEPDPLSSGIRLSLSKVVGSLAVANGDDAGIVARPDSHLVIVEVGEANFFIPTNVISLSTVVVGDTATAAVAVSNPAGTVPLLVYPITSDNALFSVAPDSVVVPPDSTVTLSIAFAPSDVAFGAQSANIVFSHNGASIADSLRADAVGEGGRGDAFRDGVVDVVDLVQLLDFVLQRVEPDSLQLVSGDLYPFPEGDGMLDVRDLTVLSHAIVNDQWPDSIGLPVLGQGEASSSSLIAGGDASEAESIAIDSTWTLALESGVRVRAFQAVLAATSVADVRAIESAAAPPSVVTTFTRSEAEVRVVSYRADGGMMEAGIYELLEIEPSGDGGNVKPLYVIGVDEDLRRVPVTIADAEGKGAEKEVPGDVLRLGAPYPNPVRFSEDERLRLPLAGRPSDSRGRAAVFNILGQRVRLLEVPERGEGTLEWDGRDQRGGVVSPGIYFIRLEGTQGPTRAAVVLK